MDCSLVYIYKHANKKRSDKSTRRGEPSVCLVCTRLVTPHTELVTANERRETRPLFPYTRTTMIAVSPSRSKIGHCNSNSRLVPLLSFPPPLPPFLWWWLAALPLLFCDVTSMHPKNEIFFPASREGRECYNRPGWWKEESSIPLQGGSIVQFSVRPMCIERQANSL